ncbi:hypothetical protein WA158_002817 [Blastocystis sp. Blastoise]
MILTYIFLDNIFKVNFDVTKTVQELKPYIQRQINAPVQYQRIFYNGRELSDSETLQSCGINSDSLFEVQLKNADTSDSKSFDINRFLSLPIPKMFKQIDENPSILQEIKMRIPPLGEMFEKRDQKAISKFILNIYMSQLKEREKEEKERKELEKAVEENPFDVETQRKLENHIHQEQVRLNRAMGMMYNKSNNIYSLLYINCFINDVPTTAIVDTGAQVCVISDTLATKCHVTKNIDESAANKMMGIGESNSLGTVFSCQLRIQDSYFSCALNILPRQDDFFLLGLDFIQSHNSVINLKTKQITMEIDTKEPPTLLTIPIIEKQTTFASESQTTQNPSTPIAQSRDTQNTISSAPISSSKPKESVTVNNSLSNEIELPSRMKSDYDVLISMGVDKSLVKSVLLQVDGDIDKAIAMLVDMGIL